MTLALRRWGYFVFLWLSLGTAAVHAIVPLGSPLVARSGSAFSAFTSDLSLGPQRAAQPEKGARHHSLPDPGTDGGQGIFASQAAAAAALQLSADSAAPPAPLAGGPFATERPSSRFQARAPPRP